MAAILGLDSIIFVKDPMVAVAVSSDNKAYPNWVDLWLFWLGVWQLKIVFLTNSFHHSDMFSGYI
jgi:hypothetical protein